LEFDQLRHFLKAAELSSFTRAAEAVALSQPALSRSIARLEEELGQPLFERQTRKIALTDVGKLLQTRAQQILALVENTQAEICDDGQTGIVRVAAIPTVAPFMLPKVLRRFSDSHPHAAVIVHEDTTDNLLKKLSEGVVDIALLALPLTAKYLEVEELFEEELLLVMCKDHPLSAKKHIRLLDIEPLPFVLLGEAHCLTDNIVSFCRQKAFHPMSVESTSQLATVQELVSLNHGISLIPEMARALDESDRRVYRSLSGTPPTRKIVLAFNPYRFQSRLMESFKQQLRSYQVI
jgi:LysR family transcriptional regulator, hydrogen peroxide-inducible genes activator